MVFWLFVRRSVFVVSFIAIGGMLIAQSDTLSDAMTNDSIMLQAELHPVFLYAAKSLPYAISVISSDALNSTPTPIIESVLNSTPGVWMQSGALNTNRISIRGVGYREPFATTGIKIYLDEIPLTNGAGEASIEDIQPNLLSGIEVIRGPSSALWGAGLGGMILMKTATHERDSWQSKVQVGAFGRIQADQQLHLRYGSADQWGTVLQYQYLHDDGYRENNQYQKHAFTWMQHWQNAKGWTARFLMHGIALKSFISSSLTAEDYKLHPEIAAPTWGAVMGNEDYVKWISGLSVGFTSKKNFIYRGAIFGTLFSSDEVRPFNVLEEKDIAFGTRHRVAWQIHRAGQLTAGFEFYRENYDASTFETLAAGTKGEQLSDETEHRTNLQLFSQSTWEVTQHAQLFAGISTAINYLSNESHTAQFPLSVYPTAGIRYVIAPMLTLSGSISRGYTAFALNDLLDSEGNIQSELKPETGWNREVSILIGNTGAMSLNVTGYVMHIRNTIITRRIMDDVFEKYSGGSTLHRGIEAEFNINSKSDRWSWRGVYTYNAHVFSEFNDGGIDYSGKTLPGVPRHHAHQQLSVHVRRNISLLLSHHWVSEVWLDDTNTLHGPGSHVMNMKMDYRFTSGEKWNWVVSGYLHNVFDTRYASMFQINAPGAFPRYYYPGKPRSIYLSIGFQYAL